MTGEAIAARRGVHKPVFSTSGCAVAMGETCLALVLVPLCASVGVVAVGRLADRVVALDQRAERSGQRRDRRREPAELQLVGEPRCVPDVALIDRRGDEGRATDDTEDEQARVEREDREPQSRGRGEVEEDDGLAVVLPGGPFP
jgi:hypothetical protein